LLSEAGRVLLNAADDARADLAKSPVFTRIGSEMPDGSIYVGLSRENNRPMYMVAQEGPKLNWYDAMNYVRNLNAHGHQDWRLPTTDDAESLTSFFKKASSKVSSVAEPDSRSLLQRVYEPEGHWLATRSIDKAWLATEATGQPTSADPHSKQPVRPIRHG
jgi:hypothetical protein